MKINRRNSALAVVMLAALFLVSVKEADAACANDANTQFRSAATGDWNNTATWECSDDGVNWQAATVIPTSANGAITIRNLHTVTVTAAVTVDQVTVDSGGQVTVNSGNGWTIANGTGTDLTINGTVLNSGLSLFSAAGPTWVVNAGGTYIHNTTSGIATPLAGATLNAASNFLYRGSSTITPAISVSGRTYGNLTFESTSGAWTASVSGAGGLTINGDFVIGNGVTYNTTQTGVMTFAGNFTNNGTLTNSTGTQVYAFTGSGKTIGGSGAIQFETWNVNSGASISLSSNVSIASTFTGTITGTLNTGANLVSGAGNFSLVSGSSLGIGDSNGITSSGASGNIQVTGTRTFATGANYIYSGSALQNAGNGLPASVNNLTTSTGTTLDVGSALLTVNGTLTNNGAMKRSAPAQTITNGSGVVFNDAVNKPTAVITQTAGTDMGSTSLLVTAHLTPTNYACGSTTLGGNPVRRTYSITPTVTSGVTATVRLYYYDGAGGAGDEANGNTLGNLAVYHCDGTTWTRFSGGTTGSDATTGYNYIELPGVTTFSPFGIGGGPGSPTAVTLSSFNAQAESDAIGWLGAGGFLAALFIAGAFVARKRRR